MSRQFTEQEAQRVFARIAEMQRADASRVPGALSREDLEEAASAAGLDASYVARAIAELDAAPERSRTLMGAPVEVVRQRVIPGPLDDETWSAMVEAARTHFGGAGMAGQIGRLREWNLISGGTKNGLVTRLSAEPTENGVRVMLSQNVRETVKGFSIAGALTAVMGIGIMIVALFGTDPEAWTAAAIVFAMALLFAAGSQVWARWWATDRSGQFDALMDRLDLIARASGESGRTGRTSTLEASAPAPMLGLDALPDSPSDASGADRRRIRS